MLKYKNIKDKKISILKNVLINGNIITAYYVIYPFNYNLMDLSSAERHIQRLYNAINNLYSSIGEVKMSMFQLKNIVSKEETINSIVKTIKMYKKDYTEFPKEYRDYIKNITRDFSILAIQIEAKQTIDMENQNLKSIISQVVDNFIKENFTTSMANVNEDQIAAQNTRIKNILSRYAVPANEKLVMNIYVNSLFPSYNLVYNNYLLDNKDVILGSVKQEIIPHLGWFEMTNSGIADFGGIPKTTYGSILTILDFPESIQSENFNMFASGLHVNMHLLPKTSAILKFKRMRADINEELEEAVDTEAKDTDIDEHSDFVQHAIDQIRRGRIVTEVDANILIVADTKEELDRKKKSVISILSDINVVCSIDGNQAKTFVNSFIKNNPSGYYHLMDLQYALSFQLDDGLLVGDQDSKFASPVIGIS